jgi:hypothetical protein
MLEVHQPCGILNPVDIIRAQTEGEGYVSVPIRKRAVGEEILEGHGWLPTLLVRLVCDLDELLQNGVIGRLAGISGRLAFKEELTLSHLTRLDTHIA